MCAKHFLEGSILEKIIMEKQQFFQAAMAGFDLGYYRTGGYARIWVYEVEITS